MSIIVRPESTADEDAIRHVNRLASSQEEEARHTRSPLCWGLEIRQFAVFLQMVDAPRLHSNYATAI